MSGLRMFLLCAVPLRIEEYKARGGPSDGDFERVRTYPNAFGSGGDVLLFGGGKTGEAARLADMLSDALAVLAFLPGGVDAFGAHFEVEKF